MPREPCLEGDFHGIVGLSPVYGHRPEARRRVAMRRHRLKTLRFLAHREDYLAMIRLSVYYPSAEGATSLEALSAAMGAEGTAAVLADVANYTTIAPVLQTSDIVT